MSVQPVAGPRAGTVAPADLLAMAYAIIRLEQDYGRSWTLERADFWTITATRREGTMIHTLAGPPEDLLRRLDCLPKLSARPGVIVAGPWPSGMCA